MCTAFGERKSMMWWTSYIRSYAGMMEFFNRIVLPVCVSFLAEETDMHKMRCQTNRLFCSGSNIPVLRVPVGMCNSVRYYTRSWIMKLLDDEDVVFYKWWFLSVTSDQLSGSRNILLSPSINWLLVLCDYTGTSLQNNAIENTCNIHVISIYNIHHRRLSWCSIAVRLYLESSGSTLRMVSAFTKTLAAVVHVE